MQGYRPPGSDVPLPSEPIDVTPPPAQILAEGAPDLVMYVRGEHSFESGLSPLVSGSFVFLSLFVPVKAVEPGGPLARTQTNDSKRSSLDPSAYEGLQEGLSLVEEQCLRLVLDIARRLGRPVHVVDVNHQDVPPAEIERYLGEPPFPVLVRPDGTRLAGSEYFTPRSVRRFILGA